MTLAIRIIGRTGPSMPMSLPQAAKARKHMGAADPIWGTQFTTKFSRKPAENAPPPTPMGTQRRALEGFLDRVSEIDYLASTQHQELATTRQELKAVGLATISLSQSFTEEYDSPDITEAMVNRVASALDPTYASTLERRIEWEQFTFRCGPVHRARFSETTDGKLGIDYDGPRKFKGSELATEIRRRLKYLWIDLFGALPSLQEIAEGRAFAANYGAPVLAHMTDEQHAEWRASKMFGTEDPDPGREAFHAENPRTAVLSPFTIENPDGTIEETLITDDLPGGIHDIGYAGPKGFLGLDDDAPQLDDEFEYFSS